MRALDKTLFEKRNDDKAAAEGGAPAFKKNGWSSQAMSPSCDDTYVLICIKCEIQAYHRYSSYNHGAVIRRLPRLDAPLRDKLR
jgi:hypothetical protein